MATVPVFLPKVKLDTKYKDLTDENIPFNGFLPRTFLDQFFLGIWGDMVGRPVTMRDVKVSLERLLAVSEDYDPGGEYEEVGALFRQMNEHPEIGLFVLAHAGYIERHDMRLPAYFVPKLAEKEQIYVGYERRFFSPDPVKDGFFQPDYELFPITFSHGTDVKNQHEYDENEFIDPFSPNQVHVYSEDGNICQWPAPEMTSVQRQVVRDNSPIPAFVTKENFWNTTQVQFQSAELKGVHGENGLEDYSDWE